MASNVVMTLHAHADCDAIVAHYLKVKQSTSCAINFLSALAELAEWLCLGELDTQAVADPLLAQQGYRCYEMAYHVLLFKYMGSTLCIARVFPKGQDQVRCIL